MPPEVYEQDGKQHSQQQQRQSVRAGHGLSQATIRCMITPTMTTPRTEAVTLAASPSGTA
jgi:hypothetical protein